LFVFLDGNAGGGDWNNSGPSPYGSYNQAMMPSHLPQSYPPPNGVGSGMGPSVQLPPPQPLDPMGGYSHPGIPSNGDSPLIASSLPPMSTFRSSGSGPPQHQSVPSSTSTTNSTTSSIYNSHSPSLNPPPPPQAGDTVGKALASVSSFFHLFVVYHPFYAFSL